MSLSTSDGSTDKLVAYVQALYDLSAAYGEANPGTMTDKNRRVMEYLRQPKYNDLPFRMLLGKYCDSKFIAYVDKHNETFPLVPVADFQAPSSPGPVRARTAHWAATLNGVYVLGVPPAGGSPIGKGDVAGWGGDWITFYGEWARDYTKEKDGYAYCKAHLFRDRTTFKMQDLIEDIDAFNIGMALRADPTKTVADAVKDYYGGTAIPTWTRYNDFCTDRYGSPLASDGKIDAAGASRAASLALAMLMDISDAVICFGRNTLIKGVKYGGTVNAILHDITSTEWDIVEEARYRTPTTDETIKFCDGYKDVLMDLVLKEATGQPVQP